MSSAALTPPKSLRFQTLIVILSLVFMNLAYSQNKIYHLLPIKGKGMYIRFDGAQAIHPISNDHNGKFGLWVERGVVSEDFVFAPSANWADFVFDKDYDLQTLEEVEQYIALHGHLPNIPSADSIYAKGYRSSEMNVKFLAKIEELTVYTIQQHKEITALKKRLEDYETLESRLKQLESILKD